ncbi:L,D-transpeptidase family protein [Streptomyces krungchingensis]
MMSGRMTRRGAAVLLATLVALPAGPAAAEPGPVAPGPGSDHTVAGAAAACTEQTGPYQRRVERGLGLKADGKQSPADCRAIRAFQKRYAIKPDVGFAGPVTWTRIRQLAGLRNPNVAGKCPVRSYRVACVDLTRQLSWVQKGTTVLWGPVSMRSGRAGHRTRTGWFTVYWKHENHWSTLYNTPMQYSQFFSGGQAFHAIRGSVHDPDGSWGCVNLRLADARKLWDVLKKGDRVYVWGRRPGT